MSKHLGEMKQGDSIEAKGPVTKLEYKPNMKQKIGLIAGARMGALVPMQHTSAHSSSFAVALARECAERPVVGCCTLALLTTG